MNATIWATLISILLSAAFAGWRIYRNSVLRADKAEAAHKEALETIERLKNDAAIVKQVNDEISNFTPDAIHDELQRDWKEPPKQ